MADLSVTAGSVVPFAGAVLDATRNAGATITQGQTVYLDAATNTYKLFDANVAAQSVLAGVSLVSASSGQPIIVVTAGPYNPGATVVTGTTYIGSATNPGGFICPDADAASGWYKNILGVATASNKIQIQIQASGVAI